MKIILLRILVSRLNRNPERGNFGKKKETEPFLEMLERGLCGSISVFFTLLVRLLSYFIFKKIEIVECKKIKKFIFKPVIIFTVIKKNYLKFFR